MLRVPELTAGVAGRGVVLGATAEPSDQSSFPELKEVAMAVAQGVPALFRIEAGDVEHAGALVQMLVGVFAAEDVALDGDSLEVQVRPSCDSNEAVLRVLNAVEGWLLGNGLASTTVHFEGRSYRVDAPR